MAHAFLQGEFLDVSQARVSALDAGLQHGVGLFETMLALVADGSARDEVSVAERVRVLHLPEHIRRLVESCVLLGLTTQLRAAPLEEAVVRTVARAAMEHHAGGQGQQRFRVRATITGGDLNLLSRERGRGVPTAQDPTVLVVAQPAAVYPRAMQEQGVPVVLGGYRANPLDPTASHKTLNYWPRLRELQLASARGASEALVLDVTNHLVGGCVSSVLIVKDGRIRVPIARGEEEPAEDTSALDAALSATDTAHRTPHDQSARADAVSELNPHALPSCVLPGITRRWAMEWADDELVDVARGPITMREVLDADEVLLLNSSWGVLPVVAIESRLIGSGAPGPIARGLIGAWDALLS